MNQTLMSIGIDLVVEALIARRVQAAVADVGARHDAYQRELDGQMFTGPKNGFIGISAE